MRRLGATVVVAGSDFDEAKDTARAFAREGPECLFVEAGDEPQIAEGAGTIGIELTPLAVDTLMVPVGNGAAMTGSFDGPRLGTILTGANLSPALLARLICACRMAG
jgi:threonine dehydratase